MDADIYFFVKFIATEVPTFFGYLYYFSLSRGVSSEMKSNVSSKKAPRILIFSIAMDADYSFYMKFIATRAPTFFGYIISVLANVRC